MRVDNSNLPEITRVRNHAEIKGNVSVSTEESSVRKTEFGRAGSVQQTTVDRPFFSDDSQMVTHPAEVAKALLTFFVRRVIYRVHT